MTWHAHFSSKDGRTIALTADKEGHALPKEENEWVYCKSGESELELCIALGIEDVNQVREDIAKDGYHICRLKRILHKAP